MTTEEKILKRCGEVLELKFLDMNGKRASGLWFIPDSEIIEEALKDGHFGYAEVNAQVYMVTEEGNLMQFKERELVQSGRIMRINAPLLYRGGSLGFNQETGQFRYPYMSSDGCYNGIFVFRGDNDYGTFVNTIDGKAYDISSKGLSHDGQIVCNDGGLLKTVEKAFQLRRWNKQLNFLERLKALPDIKKQFYREMAIEDGNRVKFNVMIAVSKNFTGIGEHRLAILTNTSNEQKYHLLIDGSIRKFTGLGYPSVGTVEDIEAFFEKPDYYHGMKSVKTITKSSMRESGKSTPSSLGQRSNMRSEVKRKQEKPQQKQILSFEQGIIKLKAKIKNYKNTVETYEAVDLKYHKEVAEIAEIKGLKRGDIHSSKPKAQVIFTRLPLAILFAAATFVVGLIIEVLLILLFDIPGPIEILLYIATAIVFFKTLLENYVEERRLYQLKLMPVNELAEKVEGFEALKIERRALLETIEFVTSFIKREMPESVREYYKMYQWQNNPKYNSEKDPYYKHFESIYKLMSQSGSTIKSRWDHCAERYIKAYRERLAEEARIKQEKYARKLAREESREEFRAIFSDNDIPSSTTANSSSGDSLDQLFARPGSYKGRIESNGDIITDGYKGRITEDNFIIVNGKIEGRITHDNFIIMNDKFKARITESGEIISDGKYIGRLDKDNGNILG